MKYSYECLDYSTDGKVAILRLNRPAVLNAINGVLKRELLSALGRINADPDIRVVVLSGAGRSFSAGADIAEKTPEKRLPQISLDEEFKPILLTIAEAPKPYISAINGHAAGIAGALALACDLAVMAEDACIYPAFTAIGLIPDGGLSWLLARQIGPKRAYEAIIECEKMSAERCLALGLVNRVAPPEGLMAETIGWAHEIAGKAPLAVRYTKEALWKSMELDFADTISYEAKLQNLTFLSHDAKEGIGAFLEKRRPEFRGK